MCKRIFLPLLAALSAAQSAPYDPIADPASVVTQGMLRVTMLSPSLVRVEAGANASGGNGFVFDDRATLSVVNRRLPVPAYSVTRLNASAVRVDTAVLSVTLVSGGAGGAKDTCAGAVVGADAASPARSPSYPNGTRATSSAACCALCNADPACSAWVFDEVANCYPLLSSGGSKPAVNRTLGGGSGALPAGTSVAITFTGPGGSAVTWTPAMGVDDDANLNGTYNALDCYTTPMQCNDVYVNSMRRGLLSTSGWAALDDTATGRFVAAPDAPGGMPTWWSADKVDSFDLYFHAYADLNFRGALAEWTSIMGRAPMLPQSAFGVWWSRYWPYNQTSIVDEVLMGYKNFSIPLNNLVFDMVRRKGGEGQAAATCSPSSPTAIPPISLLRTGTRSPKTKHASRGATTTSTPTSSPTWSTLQSPCTRTAPSSATR